MRKLTAIILALSVLLVTAAAFAEDWTCPVCGRENDSNFCPWCGTERPSEADTIICAGCGAEYDAETAYRYCVACGAALRKEQPLSSVGPGSVILFGRFEQDNDPDNGPEPIEWIVLEADSDRTLLVSRYALDARPYHTESADITWEQCSLRAWLNGEFLEKAFTDEEREAVLLTHLDNAAEKASDYLTVAGNDTDDSIFLLSDHDAFDLYFWSDEEMLCAPTDYAIANGAYLLDEYDVDGRPAVTWWLRSPGYFQNNAEGVFGDGLRNSSEVNEGEICVRPAFWIDLNSGFWVTTYSYHTN